MVKSMAQKLLHVYRITVLYEWSDTKLINEYTRVYSYVLSSVLEAGHVPDYRDDFFWSTSVRRISIDGAASGKRRCRR